jgi:hypothetical protein
MIVKPVRHEVLVSSQFAPQGQKGADGEEATA